MTHTNTYLFSTDHFKAAIDSIETQNVDLKLFFFFTYLNIKKHILKLKKKKN